MRLTARQLNRATLARQLLLRREPINVVEAVHRVVALQAQEAASPYIGLWNRLAPFDASDLDAAFADHAVVKASLMRITLHAVDATDYPAFHEAMLPTLRASRLNDARFKAAGITIAHADALVPDLLAHAEQPRTNADFDAWYDERLGELAGPGPWWAMRTFAPLWHAPTGGPWSYGPRPSYIAAREDRRPGHPPRSGDPEVALRWLIRRYLEGFGPASVQDVAQFAMVQRARARGAIGVLAGSLVRLEGPGGIELFDVPDGRVPPEDTPAPPRLLPMWDSTLLAYSDRGRVIPPEYRKLVTRNNGDVLPTLLIDGHVAGVWRPVEGGIEATAFHRLDDDVWEGLETEARALAAFLADRQPMVYHGRFAHWWGKLSSAEVRVLS